jgi:hypothetical protein
MGEEIPKPILDPPEKYDKIINEEGKAGKKPNLLVDGRAKLYVTHVQNLVVDGPLSDREYTNEYCQFTSFGGFVEKSSRNRYVEFLQAVWQAVDYIEEYKKELQDLMEDSSED